MNQTVTFITPAYTYTPSSSTSSSHFMARPVKHWRKAVAGPNPSMAGGYSRASMGMPMDRPGESTSTGTGTCTNTSAIPLTAEIIKFVCQTRIKANTQFSETSYPDTQSFLKTKARFARQAPLILTPKGILRPSTIYLRDRKCGLRRIVPQA